MTNWKRKINGYKKIAVDASLRRIDDRTEILEIMRSRGTMADKIDKIIDYFRGKYQGTRYYGLPLKERLELYSKYDGRCMWCDKKILFGQMTVEHIVPLGEGGDNLKDNLGSACLLCNTKRHGIILANDGYLVSPKRKEDK